MKAVAKTSTAHGFELIDVPVPKVGPKEVLFKVKATAICGSDIHAYESSPGMLAMMKLPVVLTERVGVASLVKEYGAGIVTKKDEKEIAEAILQILNTPTLGSRMGGAGRKLVEERFEMSNIAARWFESYRNLL